MIEMNIRKIRNLKVCKKKDVANISFPGPFIDSCDPAIALSIILGRVGNANHVLRLGYHYGNSECNALGR